jgi:small subunit ribosomal protein SAe
MQRLASSSGLPLASVDLPESLRASPDDIAELLAAGCHLGGKNCESGMARFVQSRRADGVCILNVRSLWEKLVLVARVIVAVPDPKDVAVISQRANGYTPATQFSRVCGTTALPPRFIPGTFTNQAARHHVRPQLLIATDPRADHHAILEAAAAGIAVVALCNSDSPLRSVDIAVPANNKSRQSIALVYWFLSREVLRLRGVISRCERWHVPASLFCAQADGGDAASPRAVHKGESRSRSASDACATADSAAAVAANDQGALCLKDDACNISPHAAAAVDASLNVGECPEILDALQLRNHAQDEPVDGT